MNDSPKQQQKRNRTRRLSASLRDNLRRRKAQARGRAQHDAADEPETGRPHDSAGFVEDKRSRK